MSVEDRIPESRFESVFNHVNEGILIANSRGEILIANPKCLQMFGYEKDGLAGELVEKLVPRPYADRHVEYRQNYMKHPTKRPMGKNLILYGERKDGQLFPVEISLSYYESESGMYVIAFIIDITERFEQQEKIRKINQELKLLNETLEKKVGERTLVLKEALHDLEHSRDDLSRALEKEKELNEMKSRFISMASHEFRTPLSTILSSVSLIAKYTDTLDQDKREKHVARVKSAVTGLTEILNDFLSLGKLEEGKVSINRVETDISTLVEEVVSEMQVIARPGQQIRYNHRGESLFFTDRQLLRNALINLIANAIKFSPNDQSIEVTSRMLDSELEIAVRDHGIGIPAEDQKHLFERFFRGKNASNIQGTGLGLNIVLRYVELLGGTIRFESELDKGTSFFVTIPKPEA